MRCTLRRENSNLLGERGGQPKAIISAAGHRQGCRVPMKGYGMLLGGGFKYLLFSPLLGE